MDVDKHGGVEVTARTRMDFHQQISRQNTTTIKDPETRSHALRYPDRSLWEKSIDIEFDKLDKSRTIRWLNPAQVGILTKLILTITMKLSLE